MGSRNDGDGTVRILNGAFKRTDGNVEGLEVMSQHFPRHLQRHQMILPDGRVMDRPNNRLRKEPPRITSDSDERQRHEEGDLTEPVTPLTKSAPLARTSSTPLRATSSTPLRVALSTPLRGISSAPVGAASSAPLVVTSGEQAGEGGNAEESEDDNDVGDQEDEVVVVWSSNTSASRRGPSRVAAQRRPAYNNALARQPQRGRPANYGPPRRGLYNHDGWETSSFQRVRAEHQRWYRHLLQQRIPTAEDYVEEQFWDAHENYEWYEEGGGGYPFELI